MSKSRHRRRPGGGRHHPRPLDMVVVVAQWGDAGSALSPLSVVVVVVTMLLLLLFCLSLSLLFPVSYLLD